MRLNRKSNGVRGGARPGASLLEVVGVLCLLVLVFLALFSLRQGADRSLVKGAEFLVAGAVLHNLAELYKVKTFDEIVPTVLVFDERGGAVAGGRGAFQVRVGVEPVVMPNRWARYKRVFLAVEKPGTFFGTTLLKAALLRVDWNRDPDGI